ncbi:hypothetical protein C8Q79DRAFT_927035 [Trametes meyenii]|nr:hypothetical protein C8Q79DRAFT_927035 [Trametes meyenii]
MATAQAAASSTSLDQGTRRAPYDFTGCLAHTEVTWVENTDNIICIIGFFDHNQECQKSVLVRYPAVPLHPHVVKIALLQMRTGADIGQIHNKNLEMVTHQLYRDQRNADPTRMNSRYELQAGDFSHVSIAPEQNVDNWLDQSSPHYKCEVADAVFHYAPRAERDECFMVCIATPEMCDAAWKYCHHKQLVLDGTFGVCTSRLLLWIAMGIDKAGHGIPMAMFLFLAPSGTRATHAGYNTDILATLLGKWRDWMGSRPGDGIFEPFVGMTDTDTKEQAALLWRPCGKVGLAKVEKKLRNGWECQWKVYCQLPTISRPSTGA